MKNVYLHLILSGYAGVKNLDYTKTHGHVTSKDDSQLLIGPDLLFWLPVRTEAMQKFKLIISVFLVQNFHYNQATLENTQYTVTSGIYKPYHGFGLCEGWSLSQKIK